MNSRTENRYVPDDKIAALCEMVQSNPDGSLEARAAIHEICANYKNLIKFLIARKFPAGVDIEDITQDSKLAIIEAIHTYDSTRNIKFISYVAAKIRRVIENARKHAMQSFRSTHEYEKIIIPEEEEIEDFMPQHEIPDFMTILKADEIEVIQCVYYDELDIKEISQKMNIHWRKVYSILRSALIKLRKRVIEEPPEPERRNIHQIWDDILFDMFNKKFSNREAQKIINSITPEEREIMLAIHSNVNLQEFAESKNFQAKELHSLAKLIRVKINKIQLTIHQKI